MGHLPPIEEDAKLRIITRKDDAALEMIRHDAAHVLAMAVQELFPGTQVTIGPAIEDGFYYDFARDQAFHPDDLPKIEAKMRENRGARSADASDRVAARRGDPPFRGNRRAL
jgi:threonyl-tRNA synthetase